MSSNLELKIARFICRLKNHRWSNPNLLQNIIAISDSGGAYKIEFYHERICTRCSRFKKTLVDKEVRVPHQKRFGFYEQYTVAEFKEALERVIEILGDFNLDSEFYRVFDLYRFDTDRILSALDTLMMLKKICD